MRYAIAMLSKIALISFIVVFVSCNNDADVSEHGVNPTLDLYRVKLSDYELLKENALYNNDMKSANRLANHFRYTEPNVELYNYWLAITARNGSVAASEIFLREGTTFSEFLKKVGPQHE